MDAMFSPRTAATVARARQHSVGDLLHRSAARYPDKLAVVAGDLRVSYAEFDAAVNRAAHALADRGLAKGDRLALLSHNCWQYVLLAFATARLGVVLVPVNFMLGAEEIAFILRHSGPAAWSPRPPWLAPPRKRWPPPEPRAESGAGSVRPRPPAGEEVDP